MDTFDANEFKLSLIAYLNYVDRKLKKDNSFDPHPLIKAINCAFNNSINLKIGETVIGVSGDANNYPDDSPKELYSIVIRKEDMGFTLLSVYDITVAKEIPLMLAINLIIISMKMDKFDGEYIPVDNAITIINETLVNYNIVRFNNLEWKEARDNFKKILHDGKLSISDQVYSEELRREFLSITYNTSWEDYPSRVRNMITSTWINSKAENIQPNKELISFSSIENTMPKYKIMGFVREILYGNTSEYLDEKRPDSTIQKNEKKVFFNSKKVGRNDPCPCKSGKKYKKCCGQNK